MNTVQLLAQPISLVIFDVDGVLTDGRLYFDDNGKEFKAFHSRDGLGIVMLLRTQVQVAVITASKSTSVKHRMENLGVKHVYQGYRDKLIPYQQLKALLNLEDCQIAYVGDDVIDIPIMQRVGLAIAVSDAHSLVKQYANWQTFHPGGCGAVRDVCELIMESQNTLRSALNFS